jgi:ACS family glucarate transporter-like MFS transporter
MQARLGATLLVVSRRCMNNPVLTKSGLSPTRVRYGVLGFACSLSFITYLDRVCISRVQKEIQSDLSISPTEMGLVFSAFAVGYMLFEVPSGWMGDRWGSRRVITRIVLWWSLFTALTGCIWQFAFDTGIRLRVFGWESSVIFSSLTLMLLVRFLFGCGEAGAYPNLNRVTATWFPFRERALAQGAVWMCARFGGALAPSVIGLLMVLLSWRQAFWVLGLVGAAWSMAFFFWFRDTPEQKASCNAAERQLIHSGRGSLPE